MNNRENDYVLVMVNDDSCYDYEVMRENVDHVNLNASFVVDCQTENAVYLTFRQNYSPSLLLEVWEERFLILSRLMGANE